MAKPARGRPAAVVVPVGKGWPSTGWTFKAAGAWRADILSGARGGMVLAGTTRAFRKLAACAGETKGRFNDPTGRAAPGWPEPTAGASCAIAPKAGKTRQAAAQADLDNRNPPIIAPEKPQNCRYPAIVVDRSFWSRQAIYK